MKQMSDSKIDQIVQIIKDEFATDKFIPLHEPYFGGNEKKYLEECIDSTFVSSVGPFVDLFEQRIAEITETKKGVAVVNGTAGLQVALRLVGVQANDEVLTQALTFIATANAINYNQAKPVFIDVDRDTMGLSPSALKAFLEEFGELREGSTFNKKTGKRIGACVVMHTFGFPARIEELVVICDTWKIPLVEDAAESLGSTVNGKALGGFGKVGVLSFNGNKIVTSGGGGAIVSNDLELAAKAKYLTTTAKVPHPYEYVHDELGYNFRMPNINAALICAQLEQLDFFLKKKRELALAYKSRLDQLGVNFRWELPNTQPNYWLMCVELENLDERNLFLKESNNSNVMTRPIWQLMNKLPMYKECQHDGLENSLYLEDRIVNIPSSVRK
jgi:aminotransferase in exopolysaccharide biosynthesis